MKKPVDQMTRYEILDTLAEDGFRFPPDDASEVSKVIQQTARSGALLWTEDKVISMLINHPLTLHKPSG